MIIQEMTDKTILQEIGERVATYRLNKNMTQEELAREAGVSLPTINRLENGHTTQLTSLLRVLRVLDMVNNLDALLPEPVISPLERLKMNGRKRFRASKPRDENNRTKWSWGNDE